MALRDIPLSICTGPKKPEMGPYFFTDGIAPLKLFCTQIVSAERSRVEDFRFLKKLLLKNENHCPDFHGLTRMMQELQATHQNPNQKSSLGNLLTKLHLNLRQCFLQW